MAEKPKLTPSERITKAKWKLTRDHPFFSVLVMSLKDQEDTNKTMEIPTIGVNAYGEMLWNADFINTLDDEELVGVLAHEGLHFGLNHMLRGQGRDHGLFCQACDLVVNDILNTAGMKLPHGGLVPGKDHKFNMGTHLIDKINERPAEDVYRIMLQNAKGKNGNNGGNSGNDKNDKGKQRRNDGGWDNHDDKDKPGQKPMSNQERKQREQDAKSRMVEAINQAKERGNIPVGMERLIRDLLKPRTNWRALLNAAITDQIPSDYSWRRPSKRSQAVGRDAYLPTVIRDKTVEVTVAVDTSGSISGPLLKKFVSEVVGLCNTYPNVKMTLMSHDHAVHSVMQVDRMGGDPVEQVMKWKPKGGGGTSHVPVWEYINDKVPDTKICVLLTDGYTDFGKEPRFQTIWLICQGGIDPKQVPFGKSLGMPGDDEPEEWGEA